MGSLQIKNKRYYGTVYVPSQKRHIQRALGVSTDEKSSEKKAKVALAKLEKQLKRCSSIDWFDISFTEFLEKWLENTKDNYKPSTWEGYEKNVHGKIIPYFKDKKYKLHELKGMYFSEYFNYLKEHGRSDGKGGLKKKSILNIRGVLSAAFDYALANDLIEYNYIERSMLPKFTDIEKHEPVVYSADEIRKLLEYAKQVKSSMLLFLNIVIFTGARKGEILGLTWDCIDFENATISIKQNRTGSKKEVLSSLTTPKSINSIRIIPIRNELLELLKKEKEKQNMIRDFLGDSYRKGQYDYVICKEDGSEYNPNSINRIIKRLTQKAGLPPCRIHDYRHAFASILFEAGIPLQEVTTLLGHGQTSTTERIYVHKRRIGNIESINTIATAIGL